MTPAMNNKIRMMKMAMRKRRRRRRRMMMMMVVVIVVKQPFQQQVHVFLCSETSTIQMILLVAEKLI